jgi:membrane-anchored protein YejM (alkaline phosphatase superfamily)
MNNQNNQNIEAQVNKKLNGKLFYIILFIALSIEYYAFVFEVIANSITPENVYKMIAYLAIFHFLIFLLYWLLFRRCI